MYIVQTALKSKIRRVFHINFFWIENLCEKGGNYERIHYEQN